MPESATHRPAILQSSTSASPRRELIANSLGHSSRPTEPEVHFSKIPWLPPCSFLLRSVGLGEFPPCVRSANIHLPATSLGKKKKIPCSPWRIVYSSTHKNESVFRSQQQKLPLHLQAASQPRHLEMLRVAASCQESQLTAPRSALLCLEIWTTFFRHLTSYYDHFCA